MDLPSQICLDIENEDVPFAPRRYEKVYSSHREDSRKSMVALKGIQKCLKEAGKETVLGFLWWIWGGARVRVPAQSLNFPLGAKEGAPGFSYQLSQVWDRRGRGGSEA